MNLSELKKAGFVRSSALIFFYGSALIASLWLAIELRFDFNVPSNVPINFGKLCLWVVSLKLILLWYFRQFGGMLGYFSLPDLRRLFFAMGSSFLIMLAVWFYSTGHYSPPRGVIVVDFLLSLMGLAAVRLSFRLLRERFLSPNSHVSRRMKRVGIIGAGDVGAGLARELLTKRGLGLIPVAFFDDDKGKWRLRVHQIPVIGAPEALLVQKHNLQLDEVIIAMPSASAKRIGEVVRLLQSARLKFETVPSVDQLATGRVKVSQLRSVEIQDLLGREPVALDTENIRQILQGRVVMVTGAGGSIGAELCRQIASFAPSRLLLVEQSEVQMFLVEQELVERGHGVMVVPLIADVLDELRMEQIFTRYKPSMIFHAAAHKHVPMMESQPSEAIKNNTFGTARMATMAQKYQVERFVLVSTDKAINPTNVMGVTKRMAEIYLQALHASDRSGTKFMAVRFGNVLGSSGSVIPVFNKQIAAGGPLKVTHPDVTRYFMTIPEAVGLVLQSAAQGSGGEIFVLDMGKPVKIVDLARQLIELSGLQPDVDIEIEFVGLRPGEKLFEELSHEGENITKTNHPKIMRFVCEPKSLVEVKNAFDELSSGLHTLNPDETKRIIQKFVPEYRPYLT
jgi:FlaA1/EpsC-like NDP-sugar epimerase